MNALTILDKCLTLVTPSMHKVRFEALRASVISLLNGAPACVTGIGRGIETSALEKHAIKRADRLLSNAHILAELPEMYGAMSYLFSNISKTPVVLVDWSDLDEYGRHFLLRASIAFSGRAITLYQELHPLSAKEKPQVHRRFLQTLKGMLADDCQPIVVTDAGFKTPWFREVQALGWHFVGRVRGRTHYSRDGDQWQPITHLYAQASRTPKAEPGLLTRSNPLRCHTIVVKHKPKGRQDLSRSGQRRQSGTSRKSAKGATDPWLLCTSLPMCSGLAKRVVNIYSQRMQIEESFRDMKSSQFGLGLEQNRTQKLHRLAVLVMLVTLANLVMLLFGLAIQTAGLHHQYQANTTKTRRVLSLHFLGLRGWAKREVRLTRAHWLQAILQLQNYIQGAAHAPV